MTGILSAAILAIEKKTNRKFVGDGTLVTRRYDPPRRSGEKVLLTIPDHYAVTEVYTSWDGSTGQLLTLNEDYILYPLDRDITLYPIQQIEFLRYYSTGRLSIAVKGRLGWTDPVNDLPEDLNRAILLTASAEFLRQNAGATGYATEEKLGDAQVKYSGGSGEFDTINRFDQEARKLLRSYIKVV